MGTASITFADGPVVTSQDSSFPPSMAPSCSSSEPASIGRREAVRRVALLLGGVVSAPTAAGVLQGCSAPSESGWTPATLSVHQNELVVTIGEMIIPATDTPGAKAANVNRFVDRMLTEWYTEEESARFLDGLDGVDGRTEERFGVSFLEGSDAQRTEVIAAMDREVFGDGAEGGGGTGEEDSEDGGAGSTPFFRTMKELTLFGYYTSEIGMTEELQWIAAPGRYDGCAPLEEVGRTWA